MSLAILGMEVVVYNINVYYKLELIRKAPYKYKVKPIAKVYNHDVFNQIFEDKSVEFKFVYNENIAGQCQLFITEKKSEGNIVLGSINITDKMGGLICLDRTIGKEKASFNFFQFGYGKFANDLSDVMLVRVDTDEALLEIFICRNPKISTDELFEMFTTSKLNKEIQKIVGVLDNCENGFQSNVLIKATSRKNGRTENSNINIEPYNDSL